MQLTIGILVCGITAILITIPLVRKRTENKEEGKRKSGKELAAFFIAIAIASAYSIGVMQSVFVEDVQSLSASSIRPVRSVSFSLSQETSEMIAAGELTLSLSLREDELWLDEDVLCVVGEDCAINLGVAPQEVEVYSTDFRHHATVYRVGEREYTAVLTQAHPATHPAEPIVWRDTETDSAKLYIASPVDEDTVLLLYTDITGLASDSELEEFAAYLEAVVSGSKLHKGISEQCSVVNGCSIRIDAIDTISPFGISFCGGSFLCVKECDEKATRDLCAIYGDTVKTEWKTLAGYPADEEGRVAYVRVQDGWRFTLFAQPEELEELVKCFDFISEMREMMDETI